MKLRHWIIAGAASCSLASAAVAQQQPGTPGQEGGQQSPGVTEQERAGQPGAMDQERAGQRGMMDQERAGQAGAMDKERAGQPGMMDQQRAGQPGGQSGMTGQQPGTMGQERGAMQRKGMTGQERAGQGQVMGEPDPEVVRQVQQKLKEEGYQVGPVDGIWGPRTQAALLEFQQAEGLRASGFLNQETIAALDIQPGAAAAGGEAGEPGTGTEAGAAEQDQQQQQGQQPSPLESPGQQPQQSPQQ